MGAWGSGTFDNDTACDFAGELCKARDLKVAEKAIDAALDPDEDYLDSDEGCEALAGCEVIARLQGRWGVRNSYSAKVDAWVEAHPQQPTAALVAKAAKAIDRIAGKGSELSSLWEGDAEWLASIADLRARVVG